MTAIQCERVWSAIRRRADILSNVTRHDFGDPVVGLTCRNVAVWILDGCHLCARCARAKRRPLAAFERVGAS